MAAITVQKLLEQLEGADPKAKVYLQIDPEGNGYWPLAGADLEVVFADERVYDTNMTAEDADMEPKEWAKVLRKPRCVVLYPGY